MGSDGQSQSSSAIIHSRALFYRFIVALNEWNVPAALRTALEAVQA